jgi:hypothetical protein
MRRGQPPRMFFTDALAQPIVAKGDRSRDRRARHGWEMLHASRSQVRPLCQPGRERVQHRDSFGRIAENAGGEAKKDQGARNLP